MRHNSKRWVFGVFGFGLFLIFSLNPYFSSEPNSKKTSERISPDFIGWLGTESREERLQILTLDGFLLSCDFFRSSSSEPKGTLILLPDWNDSTYEGVKLFKEILLKKFHITILYPRGHKHSQNWLGKNITNQDLANTQEQAEKFRYDYEALLQALDQKRGVLGLGETKFILVAGGFHSSLALKFLKEKDIDGMVLLAPQKKFFKTDLSDAVKNSKLPLLVFADSLSGLGFEEWRSLFQSENSKLEFVERSVKGFRLVQKHPETIVTIEKFAESL